MHACACMHVPVTWGLFIIHEAKMHYQSCVITWYYNYFIYTADLDIGLINACQVEYDHFEVIVICHTTFTNERSGIS
jgi:hypothetical protein